MIERKAREQRERVDYSVIFVIQVSVSGPIAGPLIATVILGSYGENE